MTELNITDIRRFESLIQKASDCVIVTHMKPDGDAMGSSIAMYHFLKSAGKENVKIVLPDPYPGHLGFLVSEDTAKDILTHQESPGEAAAAIKAGDLIICLDFNAFHRTDGLEDPLKESCASKILVDHHLNPDSEQFNVVFFRD